MVQDQRTAAQVAKVLAKTGLSVRRLAELSGLPGPSVRSYVEGTRTASPKALQALARGLRKYAATLTRQADALAKLARPTPRR